MRPTVRILVALAAGVVAATALPTATVLAAEATHVKTIGSSVSAVGTITAIDMATRHVTIRSQEGQEETFVAGKSVRLERAKVGDQVQLDYTVAVAISVKKGGGAALERTESASSSRNPASAAPGMQATSRTTTVADVMDVDMSTQMMRVKLPDGRVEDVKVRDKKALADLKVGDQVIADVHEAVALTLKPAPAAASAAAH